MAESTRDRVIGIDIGGANLKLATVDGNSRSSYFPLWTDHPRLAERLRDMLEQICAPLTVSDHRLAVTMTGEMADCFASRDVGVHYILAQLAAAAPGAQLFVYAVDGSWLSPAAACADPWRVASSNWHALASWLARAPGLRDDDTQAIVDIGSTTVDVVPVDAGRVATAARTDGDRLRQHQLVYTGMSRTPVAAILSEARINGGSYPLVAETFATSDDAYVVMGLVPADYPAASDDSAEAQNKPHARPDTADGRPRSVACARARLARMLGEDSQRLQSGEIEALAQQVVDAQAAQVAAAILANLPAESAGSTAGIFFSGHGRCLAERALSLISRPIRSRHLDDLVSPEAARCGPAAAVAWLLTEEA